MASCELQSLYLSFTCQFSFQACVLKYGSMNQLVQKLWENQKIFFFQFTWDELCAAKQCLEIHLETVGHYLFIFRELKCTSAFLFIQNFQLNLIKQWHSHLLLQCQNCMCRAACWCYSFVEVCLMLNSTSALPVGSWLLWAHRWNVHVFQNTALNN